MARVLVTGCRGFIARHVTRLLLARGDDVVGVARSADADTPFRVLTADPRNEAETVAALATVRADLVLHLAGGRTGDFQAVMQANVQTTQSLLAAVLQWSSAPRVLLVGSAAQYGVLDPAELPVAEEQPFRPVGYYGATKAWAEMLGLLAHRVHGIPVVAARVFNVCGPGEPPITFVGAVVSQLAKATLNPGSSITVGSLDAERDFVDVRDAAAALVALVERGTLGDTYNVCSGRAVTMRSVLEMLLALYGRPVQVRQQRRPEGGPEVTAVRGNPEKALRAVGWSAKIPLEHSLRDALAHQILA